MKTKSANLYSGTAEFQRWGSHKGNHMYNVLFLLLITFPNAIAYAEEFTNKKCSSAVAAVDTTPSKITAKAVNNFLDSLASKSCRGSVEYAEWSNEALFNVTRNAPTILFDKLRSSSKAIQIQVQNELGQPVHDAINYPEIYKSISKISDHNLRDYGLKVFTPFYEKHLTEVKEWEKVNNEKWSYSH